MISETTFARDYGSFWKNTTPTMDGFVRKINAGLYEREFPEMAGAVPPNRRGFVNSIAFEAFSLGIAQQKSGVLVDPIQTRVIVAQTKVASKWQTLASSAGSFSLPMSIDEKIDAIQQNDRLEVVFRDRFGHLSVGPRFNGCGIIDGCAGDILKERTLWEVKAGNRDFRAIDLRQLVTYTTLNFASKQYAISKLGLFNPRTGKSFDIDLDVFCYEVSGRTASELLPLIAYAVSNGDISR